MLSYQHGYHAGNAADVHKHIALVLLLERLRQKAAPLCYVDTHAGRGIYDLTSPEAQKTREAESGILRLARAVAADSAPTSMRASTSSSDSTSSSASTSSSVSDSVPASVPPAVSEYLKLVRSFNVGSTLRHYPGSAALARAGLRDGDRAILLERHPQEVAALKRALARDRRISVHARDCYEGLPALLPPPIRRGLVLVDPSYEIKSEFDSIATLLGKAFERWATGVYLVWYPLLPEARHEHLLRRLARLEPRKLLTSEYRFGTTDTGLQGSGLVVVNTPWQFAEPFEDAMSFVVTALDPEGQGRHTLSGADG